MDQTLGLLLTDICNALLQLETKDSFEVFGSPDNLRIRPSMTLFDAVPATFPVFGQVLDESYRGERDQRTLDFLVING